MKPAILLLVLALAKGGVGCKDPVDCSCIEEIAGVSIVDCPPPSTGDRTVVEDTGHGGSAGKVELDCCTEHTYTGPDCTRMIYGGSCPVAIEIRNISVATGEHLIIRNIYCEESETDCKMYMLDDTTTTDDGTFILPISNSHFSFSASGAGVSVTFRVVNEECASCLIPPPQCPPMWHYFDDHCYYLNNRQRTWTWHHDYCRDRCQATIVEIYDEASRTFVHNLGGDQRWVGLQCLDINNTAWYWDTLDGPVVNTVPNIWDIGYPLASIDAHCAYFPFNSGGKIRNTHCAVQYKSMCSKPAPDYVR